MTNINPNILYLISQVKKALDAEPMPEPYDPRCDMAKGPCACGAWHKPDLSKPKE